MKRIKILVTLSFILFASYVNGQAGCSPTITPTFIFYQNTTTNFTYTVGIKYLCGPNTTVYDTISPSGCQFAYLNSGCSLIIKSGCPGPHYIYLKNNSTLTILPGTSFPVGIWFETGATINNPSGVFTSTTLCTSITYPTVNCFVGIKELTNSHSVKIYPNPSLNTINISTEQNEFENSELEITNSLGQTVLKEKFKSEIDVSKLPKGFYNLKIISESKQVYYSKFIKE